MTEMKDAVAEATPSKTSYFSRILDQLRARGLSISAALAGPWASAMARTAAAAKAPSEPIARVGQGGQPILPLKQA
jgi:hypothetical protein